MEHDITSNLTTGIADHMYWESDPSLCRGHAPAAAGTPSPSSTALPTQPALHTPRAHHTAAVHRPAKRTLLSSITRSARKLKMTTASPAGANEREHVKGNERERARSVRRAAAAVQVGCTAACSPGLHPAGHAGRPRQARRPAQARGAAFGEARRHTVRGGGLRSAASPSCTVPTGFLSSPTMTKGSSHWSLTGLSLSSFCRSCVAAGRRSRSGAQQGGDGGQQR